MDVNKKVDTQINFSELENCFKVNTENTNTTLATKPKATAVRNKFYFSITHLLNFLIDFTL